MRIIKKSILLTLLVVFSITASAKHEADSYEDDIKYLFQINGSEASYQQSIKTMINYFKTQESNVPKEYWEKAEEEFMKTSIGELVKMLIPIYQKNLSHDDVLAMIEFYESAAGKRIAQKIPNISSESMQVGMSWGQAIGTKIKADIESKGFKVRLPFTP